MGHGGVSADNGKGGDDADRWAALRAKEAEIGRLTDVVAGIAAVRAKADFDMIAALKKLEAAGGTEGWRSMSQWTSWHTGVSAAEARRLADVADRLDDLPALSGAMEEGRIGLSAMASLTEVATPETDKALVELASAATGPQIAKICRDRRTRPDAPDPEPFFTTKADRGGTAFRGWVGTDDSKELDTATQRALDDLFDRWHAAKRHAAGRGDDGLPDDAQAVLDDDDDGRPSRVDAFMEMVRRALASAEGESGGGGAARYLINLHFDVDGGARFDNGDLADVATVERLLCDAGLVAMTWVKGVPVWATEKHRTPSTSLRRALNARDRCCQYPGCGASGYLEAHHIIHDEHGGVTSLANLVLVCAFHHRFLHRTGRTLSRTSTGSLIVTTATGSIEDGTRPWKPPGRLPEPEPGIRFPQAGPTAILTHYARSVWSEHLNRLDARKQPAVVA